MLDTPRLTHHLLQHCGQAAVGAEFDLDERRLSHLVAVRLAEVVAAAAALDNLRDGLKGGRAALLDEPLE